MSRLSSDSQHVCCIASEPTDTGSSFGDSEQGAVGVEKQDQFVISAEITHAAANAFGVVFNCLLNSRCR